MECIITYQKENGNIICHYCKTNYGRVVGEETSMGWKVLEIHYKYDNNYYCYEDYNRMLRKNHMTSKQKLANYLCKKLYKYR